MKPLHSATRMRSLDETTDESQRVPELALGKLAGLVAIWTGDRPASSVLPLERGELILGRAFQQELFADDERVSREHCRVAFGEASWTITDLGSRNGSYLNGARLEAPALGLAGTQLVLRVGRTLLWAVEDIRPYRAGVSTDAEGVVLGGALKRVWSEIELFSQAGNNLCLRGESGSGKELAARAFHQASGGTASSFVGVNCAAIPEGLAERLLFGARRGAYSGASTDVQGYIQAAQGGTLFLDEIAELDLRVQAKLLRVLETKEVTPLGATRAEPVELRVCAAAHANLREQVEAGRFREDLYYRVGRPELILPPLRERLDELPWLIQAEIQATEAALSADARLIESCALRAWPGNVRELLGEARRAAHRALRAGRKQVDLIDLDAVAGQRLSSRAPPEAASELAKATLPDDGTIEQALAENAGNVTRTARALGLHRNQLRRWLGKRSSSPPPAAEDEE